MKQYKGVIYILLLIVFSIVLAIAGTVYEKQQESLYHEVIVIEFITVSCETF